MKLKQVVVNERRRKQCMSNKVVSLRNKIFNYKYLSPADVSGHIYILNSVIKMQNWRKC